MNPNQQFIQELISQLNHNNQWLITKKNNITTITNSISFDQFFPYQLVSKYHQKQCKDFKQRQQYALPNTPKIILVQKQGHQGQEVLLLAQKGQYQLQKIILHFQKDLKQLEFLLQVLNAAEMLQKKYGYFKFTEGMIRASKGPSLLLWINESEVCNYPQFPIGPFYSLNTSQKYSQGKNEPMQQMIWSLLKIFIDKMKFNAHFSNLDSKQVSLFGFQEAKMKIFQMIKDQNTSQCTIFPNPKTQRLRYTQQKRKMPDFLINKSEIRTHQKQKSLQFNEQKIIKSKFANSHNKMKRDHLKNTDMMTRTVGNSQIFDRFQKSQDKGIPDAIFKNSLRVRNSDFKNESSRRLMNQQSQFRTMQFSKQLFSIQKSKKQDKVSARDSGKTVSTSSAQYFSSNGSGHKFYPTNYSIFDGIPLTTFPRKLEKLPSTHCKTQPLVPQNIQSPKGTILTQADQNVLQQKIEQILFHNSNNTQKTKGEQLLINSNVSKSVISPRQSFYNDVNNLLKSGGCAGEEVESIDHIMEGEFQKVLFQ